MEIPHSGLSMALRPPSGTTIPKWKSIIQMLREPSFGIVLSGRPYVYSSKILRVQGIKAMHQSDYAAIDLKWMTIKRKYEMKLSKWHD